MKGYSEYLYAFACKTLRTSKQVHERKKYLIRALCDLGKIKENFEKLSSFVLEGELEIRSPEILHLV
jgi:hypothetical protein